MKLFNIMKKNFKLLVRSKTSAFTILLGPLLVILLVGLIFGGKSSYELSIGYTAPENSVLTDEFIKALENSSYNVHSFETSEACADKIREGVIHTCLVFPSNFQLSNENSNNLKFLVDYSRLNLVYKVIETVSEILDTQTKSISHSLTKNLVTEIDQTKKDIDQNIETISVSATNTLNSISEDVKKIKSNSENLKLEMKEVSTSNLKTGSKIFNQTIIELEEKTKLFINLSDDLFEDLEKHISGNESDEWEEEILDLKNETFELFNITPQRVEALAASIQGISDSLDVLEEDLEASRELNVNTKEKISSAQSSISFLGRTLNSLKVSLQATKQRLDSIDITNPSSIVSPVNTEIEPIVSESSRVNFTFPYLLMLIIMFVSLLLSSTLILFEKNSRAVFRNFVTPTRKELFVISHFLTSFLIIIVQSLIIMLLAAQFLKIPLFNNFWIIFSVIIVSSFFFILLGMIIGYVFSTQEGALMTSVIIGSVFMFLSNLVIPLESIAPSLSKFINFNPYVLASEIMRKALLFNIETAEPFILLGILFGVSIIVLLILIFAVGFTGKPRFKQKTRRKG
jgi:ABC-type multidrug transport system permease subunit